MSEYVLQIKELVKSFGEVKVLNAISLDIALGEFVTILGPSGCGKTTTLRILAGLEEPDSGSVILDGQDITNLQPNLRDVNTVFQNYALFPHMNIEKNVAYSQKIRKISRRETKKRVENVLELVQLLGYQKRMPNELSGGQRQRVAIARAIINRPKILLLDEPLGALDLNLRHQMQNELKEIQQKLGITFIYITHDQEEALNMSDRIVVMENGNFKQIGTPVEIYNNPNSSYVAQFVGAANIVKANIIEKDESIIRFSNENGCGMVAFNPDRDPIGNKITIAIRGENIALEQDFIEDKCCMTGVVKDKKFAGGSMHITLELTDGSTLVSHQHDIACPVNVGDRVYASWSPEAAVVVDWEECND